MPRLRQVHTADAHPFAQSVYQMLFGDRDPVDHPGTATGTPGNWWTVFAVVPDAFDHTTAGFQFYRSPNRKLTARLRELGQIRAGWNIGSQFVFSQHCKAARAAGVTEAQLAALPSWTVAPDGVFSPLERAVLAYTDEVVLGEGRVQDATWAALTAGLGEVAIIELTYAVCSYRLHATMCRALRLEYDEIGRAHV